MQLGHGETIADTARVMSRYVDLIMIRTFEEPTLLEMAEHATVPVINGLTNRTHPCQIMADVMTFEEHRGPIAGRRWCARATATTSSPRGAQAAGQFGFDLTFTGPPTLDPDQSSSDYAPARGPPVDVVRDPLAAVEGADPVVTDTWVSMHDPQSRPGAPPQPAARLPGRRAADGGRRSPTPCSCTACLPTATTRPPPR